jgi:hypothetical protein
MWAERRKEVGYTPSPNPAPIAVQIVKLLSIARESLLNGVDRGM